jgi:hypothetical protein
MRKVSTHGPDRYSAVLAPIPAGSCIANFHSDAVKRCHTWWRNNPMIRGVAEKVMNELIEMVVVGTMENDGFETESSTSEEDMGRTADDNNLQHRKNGLLEVWVSVRMLQFCITPVVAYTEPITNRKMVIFSQLEMTGEFLAGHNSPGRIEDLLRFDENYEGLIATHAHPHSTVIGVLDIFDIVAENATALQNTIREAERPLVAADLHDEAEIAMLDEMGGPDNPFVFD